MLRVVADQAGNRVALVEPGRVLVLDVPALTPVSEVGIAGDLADHDVLFAGEAGRLCVMTRSGGKAVMHVVDPTGPTKLGEVQFRTAARLLATVGNYALTVAGNVAAVTDLGLATLVAMPLPTRGTVTAASPIGPQKVAVAIGGAVEEWDAGSRIPGRRLRLDKPLDPLALGGNAQRLFVIAKDTPDSVDIITFATRSTRKVSLPEVAIRVAPHPSGDVLAFIGGSSQHGYLLDLVRGTTLRLDRGALADLAWVGEGHALAIKPEATGIELVAVGTHGEPAPPRRPSPPAIDVDAESDAAAAATPASEDETVETAPAAAGGAAPPQWSRKEITERLASWRNRFAAGGASPDATQVVPVAPPDDDAPPAAASTPAPPSYASSIAMPASAGGWRADLAAWARSVEGGSIRSIPADARPPLDAVAGRLALSADLANGLALLYGAHLAGLRGLAPVELASVCGWQWEEALGGGTLAAAGIARWTGSRVRLGEETIAAIDNRPPRFGTRVGTHDATSEVAATSEAVALVAPPTVELASVGAWAAPALGALLIPNARGETSPLRFLLEARLRGLAPLVPWHRFSAQLADLPHPGAIIVDTAAIAATLALPVVATWA